MNKTITRVLCGVLCCALLCGGTGGFSASADSIRDLEAQLEKLQKDADKYRDKIKDSNKELASAQDQKEYYDKQIDAVSEQIILLEEAIDELDEQIDDRNDRIEEAQEELKDTNDAMADRYSELQERVRALAKTGNVTLLQMLMDTGSYTDYLLKSKAMSCIAERDQQLMEEMEKELSDISDRKDTLEKEKADLEKEKDTLDELKKKSDKKKKELDDLCDERKKLISELEKDLEYYKKKVEEAERAEREVDERLEELLKQESTVSGEITIPFFWPTPECTVITSVFGPRGQIGNLNTSSFHRGYDIARYGSAAGCKIYAAESGKVITSTNHWSSTTAMMRRGAAWSRAMPICPNAMCRWVTRSPAVKRCWVLWVPPAWRAVRTCTLRPVLTARQWTRSKKAIW